MPKLPDYTALGEAGSLRSGRERLSASDVNSGALIAKGVKSLGDTVAKIGEAEQKKEDSLDVTRAEAHKKRHTLDLARTFDEDPDHASYGMRFDVGVGTINEDAAKLIRNPKLREKWALHARMQDDGLKNNILEKGAGLARQEKIVEVGRALDTHQNIYADPASDDRMRGQAMADIDAAITLNERSGLLQPQDAEKLRKSYVQGSVLKDAQTRLDADPEGLLKDLEGAQHKKPLTFGPKGEAVGDDGQPVPNVTRAGEGPSETGLAYLRSAEAFTPTAKKDGAQYSNGYGTKAKSPNETITKEEAERRLQREAGFVADWIKSNITVPLTQRQHDALLGFGYNLGTGNLDRIKDDINAGEFEKVAQRMRSFDNFEGKPLPGLTRRRQVEAEMFEGSGPAPRYSGLDPEVRAKLLKEARRARDTTLQARLWDFKQQIKDDVESRRKTGVGRENLELDAIKKTVEPSVWDNYVNDVREADMEFEAGRDIETMDDGRLTAHVGTLVPDPGEADYGMKAKVYEKVKDRADKMVELRKKDPALAVNDFPEVKAAAEKSRAEGGTDMAAVIEARMAAQDRINIPFDERKPITRVEAKALLGLPDNTSTLSEGDYLTRIKRAAVRAEQEFGPDLAIPVMDAAVDLIIKDKVGGEAAAGVLKKMSRGEEITTRDIRRMNSLDEIEQASKAFDFLRRQYNPVNAPDPDNAIDFTSAFTAGRSGLMPTPAQEQWVIDNASEPGSVEAFDGKFGPGAAAKALAKGQKATKKPAP